MSNRPELTPGILADEVRSGNAAMRRALNEVARRGRLLWAGRLSDLLAALEEVARVDLCLARLVEGHADGLRILDQAGRDPHDGVYGVWASRSAGTGVKATLHDDNWLVHGELRFASGVDLIDRALLPVWPDVDHHVLLDIDVDQVEADRDSWHTTAMDASRSFTVQVETTVEAAAEVGPVDFYLGRPGFVVGGLGPAAVWLGGAQQILDVVTTNLGSFQTTPHQLRRVGVMEQAIWQARTALEVATEAAEGAVSPSAKQVACARTAVVLACDQVLEQAPLVVGPAGISTSPRLARALADLAVYIRQHHLDVELTRLGDDALFAHEVLGE